MKFYERADRIRDRIFARQAALAFNAGQDIGKVVEQLDRTPQMRPGVGRIQRRTPARVKRFRPDPMSNIMQGAKSRLIMTAVMTEHVPTESNQHVSEHVIFGTSQYEDYLRRNVLTSGVPVENSK